jgi:hypothetical protein
MFNKRIMLKLVSGKPNLLLMKKNLFFFADIYWNK